MKKWYQTKVRYERKNEVEGVKKVTENYLIDALSFTEAEARVTEYLQPYIGNEFQVIGITIKGYECIYTSDCKDEDSWYSVKVKEEGIGDLLLLIESSSTSEAEKRVKEAMGGCVADYEIKKVEKTTIKDVVFYVLADETEETR